METPPNGQPQAASLIEEEQVLVHNVLNELVHGLQPSIRVRRLFEEFPDLEAFWKIWLSQPSIGLVAGRGDLVIRSIQVVLEELGDDEFQTRIGIGIWTAQGFIRRVHQLSTVRLRDAMEIMLHADELPLWFSYPRPFIRLIEADITSLQPWWIFDRSFGRDKLAGLKSRYPDRDLVPFARDCSSDDVACWGKGDLSKVVIVHDYEARGFEQGVVFDTFWDWFRSAIEYFIEFEP